VVEDVAIEAIEELVEEVSRSFGCTRRQDSRN
jgi:hypothetical protein